MVSRSSSVRQRPARDFSLPPVSTWPIQPLYPPFPAPHLLWNTSEAMLHRRCSHQEALREAGNLDRLSAWLLEMSTSFRGQLEERRDRNNNKMFVFD